MDHPSSALAEGRVDSDRESRFPPTRWSIIARAQAADSDVVRTALTELCEHYWTPIYAFLRRDGYSQHDAEDFTQGFFASLLARGVFGRVQREGGKLRTYLLASLKNYLANERRAANRQKRGGGAFIVPIHAEEFERRVESGLVDGMTPERAFDRAWVLNLLATVLDKLEREYAEAGKTKLFSALRPQLVDGAEENGYAALSKELGITEGAARVAAHRVRLRYREMLLAEVSNTVDQPEAVGAELDFLLQALS